MRSPRVCHSSLVFLSSFLCAATAEHCSFFAKVSSDPRANLVVEEDANDLEYRILREGGVADLDGDGTIDLEVIVSGSTTIIRYYEFDVLTRETQSVEKPDGTIDIVRQKDRNRDGAFDEVYEVRQGPPGEGFVRWSNDDDFDGVFEHHW